MKLIIKNSNGEIIEQEITENMQFSPTSGDQYFFTGVENYTFSLSDNDSTIDIHFLDNNGERVNVVLHNMAELIQENNPLDPFSTDSTFGISTNEAGDRAIENALANSELENGEIIELLKEALSMDGSTLANGAVIDDFQALLGNLEAAATGGIQSTAYNPFDSDSDDQEVNPSSNTQNDRPDSPDEQDSDSEIERSKGGFAQVKEESNTQPEPTPEEPTLQPVVQVQPDPAVVEPTPDPVPQPVINVNYDPTIEVVSDISLEEDGSKTIKFTTSDIDGDTLTTGVGAENGTVKIVDGEITYTPNENFNGNDLISITVDDGNGGVITKTINVTVDAVNDDPVIEVVDTLHVSEDGEISGKINASDVDGDDLTFSIENEIEGLTLNSDGTYTFNAQAYDSLELGENQVLEIPVKVTDGNGGEAETTLTIDVSGVNNDLTYESESAGYKNVIGFYELDENGNPTGEVKVVIDDQNGMISGTHLSDMNPDTEYGSFIIANGAQQVDEDSVLTFDMSGDIPVLLIDGEAATKPVYHDTAAFNTDGKDHFVFEPDGEGGTTIKIEDLPNLGDADFEDVVLHANFELSDKLGDDVQAKNDKVSTDEDSTVTIDVLRNDVDGTGDTLTITDVQSPVMLRGVEVGTAEIVDGKIEFTPNEELDKLSEGEVENISFKYSVSDGNLGSDTAEVILKVTGSNNAPEIEVTDTTVTEDTAQIIGNVSDIDGTIESSNLTAQNGTVEIDEDGNLVYTPNENFSGNDSVSISITDDNGAVSTQAFVVNVENVNDGPVATDDSGSSLEEDTILVSGFEGFDNVVEDTLTLTKADTSASNSFDFGVENAGNSLAITFDAKALGTWDNKEGSYEDTFLVNGQEITIEQGADSKTFIVNATVNEDGIVNLDFGSTITGGDEGVEITNLSLRTVGDDWTSNAISINEDTELTINANDLLANDTDADGDSLSITEVNATENTHGTVSLDEEGNIVFTPEANYNGEASFTYTISDGNGGSDTATVTLNVTSVNDEPTIEVQSTATVNEDGSLTINADNWSANDVEDGELIPDLSAENGTVEIVDGNIVYTPDENYNGSDTITVSVTDSNGATTTETINVTVEGVNDGPVATDDSIISQEVFEDTRDHYSVGDSKSVSYDLGGEANEATVSVTGLGGASWSETLVINAYDSEGNLVESFSFVGTDNNEQDFTINTDSNFTSLEVTGAGIEFNNGNTGEAHFAIKNITANLSSGVEATEDTELTIEASELLANDTDVDGDSLSITEVNATENTHGTVSLDEEGNIVFTPEANYNGEASFTYTISDGNGGSDTATVTLNVTGDGYTLAPTSDLADSSDSGVSDSDNITNDNTPTITGTTEPGASVNITLGGVVVGSAIADENGEYSITTTELADGEQTLTVTATDAAGNSSTTTETVTIDTEGPTVTIDSLTTSDNTPELTGTIDDPNATVNVTIADKTYEATNNGDGTWTLPNDTIDNLDNVGIHDIVVTATDTAGNSDTDSSTNELNIFKVTDLGGDQNGTPISFKLTGDHYDPENVENVGAGSPEYQIMINGEPYVAPDGTSTFSVEANRGQVNEDGTAMVRNVPEFEIVTFNVPEGVDINSVSIKYINDAYDGSTEDRDNDGILGEDRNLVVDNLNIGGTINEDGTYSGGTTLEAENTDTTQYLASNGADMSGREGMAWNGEMIFYPQGVSIETPTIDLVADSDTGVSDSDNITADNTPTFKIDFGEGTATGDTVSINVNGTVIESHTITANEWREGSIELEIPELTDGNYEISATISNSNMSSEPSLSQNITIDTNTGPEALDDTASTSEDSSVKIDVLNNDSDAENDSLEITQIQGEDVTSGQVVTINAADGTALGTAQVEDGEIKFTPSDELQNSLHDGENSDVTFAYTVSDGEATTTANVSVNVTGNDDAQELNILGDVDNAINNDGDEENDFVGDLTTHSKDDVINIGDDIEEGVTVSTNAGNDEINVTDDISNATVDTGTGNDTLTVGSYVQNEANIDTGDGNDTVDIKGGLSGDSTIETGTGNDNVTLKANLKEGASVDTADGNDNVIVRGSMDDATIDTGSGNDYVEVDGKLTDATINTGDGNDRITVYGDNEGESFIDAGAGNDTISTRDGDANIHAGSGNDIINTGAGDDYIMGEEGADRINSGAGDDQIVVGTGDDYVDAGEGTNDTVIFNGNSEDFEVTKNDDGSYTVEDIRDGSPEGTDTIVNVEFIRFDDTINRPDSFTNSEITQVTDSDDMQNSVDENVEDGTYTGVTLEATDADGDAITYTLPDDVPFRVLDNGQVITDGEIDFESNESFTFMATATSADESTSEVEVTINVNDIEEDITADDIEVSIEVGDVIENNSQEVDSDAVREQGLIDNGDGTYSQPTYEETAKLYKTEEIEIGAAKSIRLDDAPDHGTVEVNIEGEWQEIVIGQEYDADIEVRFTPDADALEGTKDVGIGTFGDNVGERNFTESVELSDWGEVADDGKSVTFTDGALNVTTSVIQNGSEQNLGTYNKSGNHKGAGIGDQDGNGLTRGEVMKIEFEGEDINQVEFQLDGLGDYFDEDNANATEVKITAFDQDGNVIDTQGGYRESGEYADTYSFTTTVPVGHFEVTTEGSNGSYVVQNMTLSKTVVDELTFTAIADDGSEMSLTSDINIEAGMGTTNIGELIPVSDEPMTKEVRVVDEEAMADKDAILVDGTWVIETGTELVEPPMTDVTEGFEYPVDFSAELTDTDGSESLSVTITGVPEGAELSVGTDNEDGTWSIDVGENETSIDLSDVTLTVPVGSEDFELGIEATVTESSSGDTRTVTDSDDVTVPVEEIVDDTASDPILDMDIGEVTVTTTQSEGISVNPETPETAEAPDLDGATEFDSVSEQGYNKVNTTEDTVIVGDGYDAVTVNGGNDNAQIGDADSNSWATINAGNGNNTISAGENWDRVTTGSGHDNISVEDGAGEISSGSGNDVVSAQDGAGGNTYASINAGNGNNDITAGDDWDKVTTGSGNDTLSVGDGTTLANLGSGNDNATFGDGGVGHAKMDTGNGNDTVRAGDEWDQINLGDGNDQLQVGDGSSYIDGGSGNDTIIAGDAATDRWSQVQAGNGNDNVTLGDGFERVGLGSGNDTLNVGNADTNQWTNIDAGSGNDTMTVGHGYDKIDGGSGNDTVIFKGDESEYEVGERWGTTTVTHNESGSVTELHNVENIEFGGEDATIGGETTTSYEYPVDFNAQLTDTDGSETLSDITVDNLPDGATLTGTGVTANDDNSYSVSAQEDGSYADDITLHSDTEVSQEVLNDITASITSTEENGGDTATTTVTADEEPDLEDNEVDQLDLFAMDDDPNLDTLIELDTIETNDDEIDSDGELGGNEIILDNLIAMNTLENDDSEPEVEEVVVSDEEHVDMAIVDENGEEIDLTTPVESTRTDETSSDDSEESSSVTYTPAGDSIGSVDNSDMDPMGF